MLSPAKMRERITIDPDVCNGKPCIRDLQIPVSRLFSMLAAGEPETEILINHRELQRDDFLAAYAYAASMLLMAD